MNLRNNGIGNNLGKIEKKGFVCIAILIFLQKEEEKKKIKFQRTLKFYVLPQGQMADYLSHIA